AFPHGKILRSLNEAPGTFGVFFEIHLYLHQTLRPPRGALEPRKMSFGRSGQRRTLALEGAVSAHDLVLALIFCKTSSTL
ncbi:hypothetical protein, partial [Microvirga arabica]|uniref:hypothetical protein n=1 Tax=Microvirga arabica TaxID=1128671 RepID=UPI001AEDF7F7